MLSLESFLLFFFFFCHFRTSLCRRLYLFLRMPCFDQRSRLFLLHQMFRADDELVSGKGLDAMVTATVFIFSPSGYENYRLGPNSASVGAPRFIRTRCPRTSSNFFICAIRETVVILVMFIFIFFSQLFKQGGHNKNLRRGKFCISRY